MTIMLIIISIVFVLLIFPIKIGVKVYANILKKQAIVSISLFKLPVMALKITMEDLKLIITNTKGTILTIDKNQQDFDIGFILTMLKFVISAKMVNTFYGGVNSDSFRASMLSGSVLVILELFKARVKQFRKDFVVTNNSEFSFKSDVVVLTSEASVSLNILGAIVALVIAWIKSFNKKGAKKYERRKTA